MIISNANFVRSFELNGLQKMMLPTHMTFLNIKLSGCDHFTKSYGGYFAYMILSLIWLYVCNSSCAQWSKQPKFHSTIDAPLGVPGVSKNPDDQIEVHSGELKR